MFWHPCAEKYSKYDPTAFTETDEQFMHVSSFSQFSSTVEQDDEEEGADSTATIGATTNVSTSSGEEDNDGYAIKTEIDRIWIESKFIIIAPLFLARFNHSISTVHVPLNCPEKL